MADGGCVNQRADLHAGFGKLPHLQRLHPGDEGFEEALVDGPLHEEAVGGDARLAGVAHLGQQRPFHRHFEVRILEHQQRRVAAQFQRQRLDRVGGVADQHPADFRRAGERHLAAERVAEELLAELIGRPAHDLQDAFGQLRRLRALGESDAAQRRLPRRFEHHRAAGGQGGRHFAHRQHQREIPGADGAHHADGRLDDQVAFALGLRGNDAPISAPAFLGEPLEMVHGHGHFAQALGQRLAVLAADQAGDFVPAPVEFGGDSPEIFAARLGGKRAPARERRVRIRDGLGQPGAVDGGNPGEGFAVGRVDHVPGRLALHERAVEIERIGLHAQPRIQTRKAEELPPPSQQQ